MIVILFVFMLTFINIISSGLPDWFSSWEKNLLNSAIFLLGIGGMVLIATR